MKITPVIQTKYLNVDQSHVSAPRGSLSSAKNIRIYGDNRLRKRRGQQRISVNDYMAYGVSGASAQQTIRTFWYNNKYWQITESKPFNSFIGYLTQGSWRWSTFDSGGWMPDYSGVKSYKPGPDKYRFPVTEANRRLVVGTSLGAMCSPKMESDSFIKKTGIGSTSATVQTNLRLAGCPRGLQARASTVDTTATFAQNWLPASSKVAYRVVWSKVDANAIETVGAPSSRTVVTNGGSAAAVSLDYVPIPRELTDAYSTDPSYSAMFQCDIYRTKTMQPDGTGLAQDPGDECYLVATHLPTAAELSAGYFTFTDIVSDSVLGDPLYTNATQEGIFSERVRPPIYLTSDVYSDCLFFANTKDKWSLEFSILAVADGSAPQKKGLTAGDLVVVGNKAMIAAVAPAATYEFLVDSTTGPGGQVSRILNTTQAIINKFNSYQDAFIAHGNSSPSDPYGTILIEERIVGGSTRPFIASSRTGTESPSFLSPEPLTRFGASQSGKAYKIKGATNGGYLIINDSSAPDFAVGDTINVVQMLGTTTAAINGCIGEWKVLSIASLGGGDYGITLNGASPSANLGAGTYGAIHCIQNNTVDGNPVTPGVGTRNVRPNRVYWSPVLEPECTTPVNWMDIGRADCEILRLFRFNDTLFVFKEDGLFKITGYDGDFIQTQYDLGISLIGPYTVDSSMGAVFAFTHQGIIRITESTTQPVSAECIDDVLMKSVRTNTTSVIANSFAIGYNDDDSWMVWVPSSGSTMNQCYVYDGIGWTERDDEAVFGTTGIDSTNDSDFTKLYTSKSMVNWVTQERTSLSISDYADESFTALSGLTLTQDSPGSFTGTGHIDIAFGTSMPAGSGNIGNLNFVGSVLNVNCTVGGIATKRKIIITGVSRYDYSTTTLAVDFAFTTLDTAVSAMSAISPVELFLPIASDFAFIPDDLGVPSAQKMVSDVSLILDRPLFTSAMVTAYSDLYPAGDSSQIKGHLDPSYNAESIWSTWSNGTQTPEIITRNALLSIRTLRTFIGRNAACCNIIELRIVHSVALESFCLVGHTFAFEPADEPNIQR